MRRVRICPDHIPCPKIRKAPATPRWGPTFTTMRSARASPRCAYIPSWIITSLAAWPMPSLWRWTCGPSVARRINGSTPELLGSEVLGSEWRSPRTWRKDSASRVQSMKRWNVYPSGLQSTKWGVYQKYAAKKEALHLYFYAPPFFTNGPLLSQNRLPQKHIAFLLRRRQGQFQRFLCFPSLSLYFPSIY